MDMSLEDIRKSIRDGEFTGPTAGLVPEFAQANLVIVPEEAAYDFLLFCVRNPKPCPLIEVTDLGSYTPLSSAPHADLRTDIPKYRVYKKGQLIEERTDIKELWQDDFVCFLLGCSFTFERALLEGGIPIRHIEEKKNVPMYKTNMGCQKAGIFHGNLVVSMRPIPARLVSKAVEITAAYPGFHGAPVHIGDPGSLGVENIHHPDFGDPPTIKEGDIPVFWACGVTPQQAALQSKIDFMMTHAPGHMMITDRYQDDILNR